MVVGRSETRTPSNPPLKDFNIPTESWEQIAQDRTKWRGLIRRGAGEYKAKRIGKAEQKCAQLKARAKASPTELSSSDLLFVLRFYGPVNPMGSCRARSVYLSTHLLGRLSPLSG